MAVAGEDVNFPSSPMYLILDQAVSAFPFPPESGPGVYPAVMQVEYVRVYARQNRTGGTTK